MANPLDKKSVKKTAIIASKKSTDINPSVQLIIEDDRTGMDQETIRRAMMDHLFYVQGVDTSFATLYDYYMALSFTVRDRLMHRWIKTLQTIRQEKSKIVYYLSAEFLMGRQLGNNLLNTNCFQQARRALQGLDVSIYDILSQEPEPGLGNGGLGRLAACFLDSLATLNIPAVGFGIRYEFGIFKQGIEDGWQVEHPEKWLLKGNPWEVARPQRAVEIGFEGHTQWYKDKDGILRTSWIPKRKIIGTPYDTLIPGFNTDMVNTLRLWSAGTTNDFDFKIFSNGDYTRAVAEKTHSENISKVLYPNDHTPEGRVLRLQQQYFFVACSMQNILSFHLRHNGSLDNLPDKVAIQLNDTHPTIAIAELMRLLLDEHFMSWDKAWEITVNTFGYTNHTLMSEALERWPVDLFSWLLPRHLEIIFEINRLFLGKISRHFPGDIGRLSRMSLIEEGREKRIRMANLAVVGSHAVNGVAKLHSELVKHQLLKDFYELWPEKFSNKTNGITPRRFMMLANPKLTYLITEKIGRGWIKNLEELKALEPFAEDESFRQIWRIFKHDNKTDLVDHILRNNGIKVDSESIFDVHVKRLHEYKRQLLNALHIITLYQRLKKNPDLDVTPRTFIVAGKSAPGYYKAKLTAKLINSIGEVVNSDPDINGKIKVVFLANFCVSLGEIVYPAADLSEQISTAGTEASGTGNMKFGLNGALTIGTLDGANVEIRDAVGAENFFLFGHTVEELQALRQSGYNPREYCERNPELRQVIESLQSGFFSRGDRDLFRPLVESILNHDEYFLAADYASYISCQDKVGECFKDQDRWTKMSILNTARLGYFSSDRTIREYCEEIWDIKPIDVKIQETPTRQEKL